MTDSATWYGLPVWTMPEPAAMSVEALDWLASRISNFALATALVRSSLLTPPSERLLIARPASLACAATAAADPPEVWMTNRPASE